MTTAADQVDDTPSPTDLQQFVYLANNVFELLETAKRELERDREAAKASLAAASSILQSEIERRLADKMMCPTAAGRMLVETSSLLLAARLAHTHSETELIRRPISSRNRLHDGRLRRVLAYIEEHLAEDITVADLANVACLSIFHFTRAFAATMGVPPHRYVSQRRLESAKVMIATGRASLSEIALDCQFSSESSFTRAFRRAIGMTPAAYRRTLR